MTIICAVILSGQYITIFTLIKDLFRTLSNICDGTLASTFKNIQELKVVNYCHRSVPL